MLLGNEEWRLPNSSGRGARFLRHASLARGPQALPKPASREGLRQVPFDRHPSPPLFQCPPDYACFWQQPAAKPSHRRESKESDARPLPPQRASMTTRPPPRLLRGKELPTPLISTDTEGSSSAFAFNQNTSRDGL